ncbi:MAG: tRNA pseudouridine(13) synthase TruD [Planctomycetes bacterium]|jgi:tRNA pseudouridine13 synthase|nr:tRNA pseudouridine(13) synthase TruD [Planctomycetota bacterium]MCL4730872.1 tRNA pseudouridine(13) synthase TruD [Planctomycetota bacterium]
MRYASAPVPPCAGTIKSVHEDFVVEEIPAYPFSGAGDHTLARVEKTGITTFEAVRRLCKAIGFAERDVGCAGLKDARAVTRQWLSFEHIEPGRLAGLALPGVRVLEVTRHGNKLKRGHLRGNRFAITLRDVAESDVTHARSTLELLARRGVPNWYDDQRFGHHGTNDALGLALVRRDWAGFFHTLLGRPETEPHAPTRAARQAFAEGNLASALGLWPRNQNLERGALKALGDYGTGEKAIRRLPQKQKQLYVSALQSRLFNRCLERRFDEYDRVWQGDLCQKENGACFAVSDPAAEQPRADALEISPTGPIFGFRMQQPAGRALELEQAVLAEAGLTLEAFDMGGGLSQRGDRRPLRFPLREAELGYADGSLKLAFVLPKGCYATVVLKEITKQAAAALPGGEDDAP